MVSCWHLRMSMLEIATNYVVNITYVNATIVKLVVYQIFHCFTRKFLENLFKKINSKDIVFYNWVHFLCYPDFYQESFKVGPFLGTDNLSNNLFCQEKSVGIAI